MLNKKEYGLLHRINYGRTNLDRLGGFAEEKKIIKMLRRLESLKLIKIEFRDGEISGFMETDRGRNTINNKRYYKWYEELGD